MRDKQGRLKKEKNLVRCATDVTVRKNSGLAEKIFKKALDQKERELRCSFYKDKEK